MEPPFSQLLLSQRLVGKNRRTQGQKEPQPICVPSHLILMSLYETGTIYIFNLEMRKLKHCEVE